MQKMVLVALLASALGLGGGGANGRGSAWARVLPSVNGGSYQQVAMAVPAYSPPSVSFGDSGIRHQGAPVRFGW
jgi:hypothetical protein